MRTPILLGANPKIAKTSAWVPVRFDNWKLVVEGRVDSTLTLYCQVPESGDETIHTINGNGEIKSIGPSIVRAEMKERGTERIISVFAEEIP
jgi:hypothetical protein